MPSSRIVGHNAQSLQPFVLVDGVYVAQRLPREDDLLAGPLFPDVTASESSLFA